MARLPQMTELSANSSVQGIASSDLALDLVLHDIAERALQTTGATGAAIGLDREGSMVCRAAAGATAPDLGVKINVQSGLTGACIRERKMQWCTDTEHDTRVDAEACRALGVRSIIVIPLYLADRISGVLEVFSSQADVFRDRDVRTLEEIGRWICDTVRKNEPTTEASVDTRPLGTEVPIVPVAAPRLVEPSPARAIAPSMVQATAELLARRDKSTKILRAIAIALAAFLVFLLGMRWFRRDTAQRASVSVAQAAQPATASTPSPDTIVPEPAGVRPKPESGRRRGPANNAALRSYDNPDSAEPSTTSRAVRTEKQPAADSEQPAEEAPKSQSKRAPEPANAIAPQELAAVGPGPLRSVPAALAPAVSPPAVNLPEPSAVSKGVVEGRLIRSVQPKYPPEAVTRQVEGLVVLHGVIGKDGSVHQLKSVRGEPLLARAAINAVQQWRYEPYKLNGAPVDMPIDITINFNLPK